VGGVVELRGLASSVGSGVKVVEDEWGGGGAEGTRILGWVGGIGGRGRVGGVVELRGLEPLTSSLQRRRSPG
jgi:hypothetical protein